MILDRKMYQSVTNLDQLPYKPLRDPKSRLTAPDHDIDSRFEGIVRRSFSPCRSLMRSASMNYVRSYEQDLDLGSNKISRYSTPFNPSTEDQPFRYDDVYGLRTWTYPIWRYLNNRDQGRKHYSTYTTPMMAADNNRSRHAYTDVSYIAGEHSFLLADTDRSLNRLRNLSSPLVWRSRDVSPKKTPYYHSYAGPGGNGVRHFGGFRSRYPSYSVKASWAPHRA